MTNEELQEKLESLKIKLKEANLKQDTKLINKYVSEINKLWEVASVEMLKNAENNGLYSRDNY
jgi:hypothetical protein|tara:strand:- start:212 stop:400 length:189 start_codon:yes stop_codon:yes gene_type:complete